MMLKLDNYASPCIYLQSDEQVLYFTRLYIVWWHFSDVVGKFAVTVTVHRFT